MIYTYTCIEHGDFDVIDIKVINRDIPQKCPDCDNDCPRRVIPNHAIPFHLKGGGWAFDNYDKSQSAVDIGKEIVVQK